MYAILNKRAIEIFPIGNFFMYIMHVFTYSYTMQSVNIYPQRNETHFS